MEALVASRFAPHGVGDDVVAGTTAWQVATTIAPFLGLSTRQAA